MPRGFGFWLWWLTAPYLHPYLYYWLYWFPWLSRWWAGIYRLMAPYMFSLTYAGLPKEQEVVFLEGQKRILEESLSQINKRLEELKKERSTTESIAQ